MDGKIFTLAPDKPFLNLLAQGLLAAHPEPHELAQVRVFVPTRRAVRALERTLLAYAPDTAVLLPRLEPLGEPDGDESFFDAELSAESESDSKSESEVSAAGESETEAVFARRLLFAKIIDTLLTTTRRQARNQGEARADEALSLASALENFLEEAEGHGIAAEELVPALENLVPDSLTARWQQNRKFLKILNEVLPDLEKENGLIVLARRHKQRVARLLEAWEKTPPQVPIYVAGSTGSIEATAQLIERVASLPNGTILLPGLDTLASDPEWQEITQDTPHPQFALARLIERLGVTRSAVRTWGAETGGGTEASESQTSPRVALIQRALAPAAVGFAPVPETGVSESGNALRQDLQRGFDGLQLLECESEEQEARAIALALRAALEEGQESTEESTEASTEESTEESTAEREEGTEASERVLQRALAPARLQAMLVTPSQRLIQRVAGQLREWSIRLDNAAGISLSRTPSGAFLLLTLEACEARWSPVLLLSVLKNPLVSFGLPRGEFLSLVSLLENHYLRGDNAARNLDELEAALRFAEKNSRRGKTSGDEKLKALLALLGTLRRAEAPLANLLSPRPSESRPIPEAWQAHRKLALALCGEGEEGELFSASGQESDKRALPVELPALRRTLAAIDGALHRTESARLPPNWYGAILRTFLAEQSFHAPFGDTRIALLSPMEARLLTAKTIVLGGLNEKSWPPSAESGPWVSHGMRHALGLPSPEERIGRSAHDFVQAAGAERVVLTRAKTQNGQPQTASRWVLRLQAMAHHLGSHHLGSHDLDSNHLDTEPDSADARQAHGATSKSAEQPSEKSSAHSLLEDASLPLGAWLVAESQKAVHTRAQVFAAQNDSTAEIPRTDQADWPRAVSVTQVAILKRNPYEFFARHILGLREGAALEAPLSAPAWGSYLHRLAEQLAAPDGEAVKLLQAGKRDQALQLVSQMARQLATQSFRQAADELALRHGRVLGAAEWFLERHDSARVAQTEVESEYRLQRSYGKGLTLVGRADRIERLSDSDTTKIIDLKSGTPPSAKQVEAGDEPQLPLLAALLRASEDREDATHLIGEYWVLRGSFADTGGRKGEIDLSELGESLWHKVAELLLKAAEGEVPWVWGDNAPSDPSGLPQDFVWRHLARRLVV